jgi:hypothetical protein
MLAVVTLGLTFLDQFLTQNKNQLPSQVVQALEAAIAALAAHKDDLISKANLEAQRG